MMQLNRKTIAVSIVAVAIVIILFANDHYLKSDKYAQQAKELTDKQTNLPEFPDPKSYDPTDIATLSEKPIFVPGRRPSPPAIPVNFQEGTATNVSLPFTLEGIMVRGEKKMAVFKHANDQDVISLNQGQILDGWTIETVSNNSVIVRSGENWQTMHLTDFKNDIKVGQ